MSLLSLSFPSHVGHIKGGCRMFQMHKLSVRLVSNTAGLQPNITNVTL